MIIKSFLVIIALSISNVAVASSGHALEEIKQSYCDEFNCDFMKVEVKKDASVTFSFPPETARVLKKTNVFFVEYWRKKLVPLTASQELLLMIVGQIEGGSKKLAEKFSKEGCEMNVRLPKKLFSSVELTLAAAESQKKFYQAQETALLLMSRNIRSAIDASQCRSPFELRPLRTADKGQNGATRDYVEIVRMDATAPQPVQYVTDEVYAAVDAGFDEILSEVQTGTRKRGYLSLGANAVLGVYITFVSRSYNGEKYQSVLVAEQMGGYFRSAFVEVEVALSRGEVLTPSQQAAVAFFNSTVAE